MANPNPLKFLDYVQWKDVKHLKNSDLYSIFHNATITANFLGILEMLLAMCLAYRIAVLAHFGKVNSDETLLIGSV